MGKLFAFLLSLLILLGISVFAQKPPSSVNTNQTKMINDSLINEYVRIIKGLNHNYVLWYRGYQNTRNDNSKPIIQISEKQFTQDSMTYWKCYNDFFSQDINLVTWLLSFKNDNANNNLWQHSLDPACSYISECDLLLTNSRSAIILIENYLSGFGFYCFECPNDNKNECNMYKYEIIEQFLQKNKSKNVDQIRKEWKKSNAR